MIVEKLVLIVVLINSNPTYILNYQLCAHDIILIHKNKI